MPPKAKYTREQIIETAVNFVRQNGFNLLTARNLAQSLNSSPKPIFCYFKNMNELQCEIISYANNIYNKYINDAMNKGDLPPYKASGMAYILFAKEEKDAFYESVRKALQFIDDDVILYSDDLVMRRLFPRHMCYHLYDFKYHGNKQPIVLYGYAGRCHEQPEAHPADLRQLKKHCLFRLRKDKGVRRYWKRKNPGSEKPDLFPCKILWRKCS